mgnify:CR=1 FL=1
MLAERLLSARVDDGELDRRAAPEVEVRAGRPFVERNFVFLVAGERARRLLVSKRPLDGNLDRIVDLLHASRNVEVDRVVALSDGVLSDRDGERQSFRPSRSSREPESKSSFQRAIPTKRLGWRVAFPRAVARPESVADLLADHSNNSSRPGTTSIARDAGSKPKICDCHPLESGDSIHTTFRPGQTGSNTNDPSSPVIPVNR